MNKIVSKSRASFKYLKIYTNPKVAPKKELEENDKPNGEKKDAIIIEEKKDAIIIEEKQEAPLATSEA